MFSKRSCPVCESRSVEFLHNQNFALPENHPLKDGYSVVTCDHCGFVFADTTASQSDYDTFYAQHSKYDDVKTSTGGGGNPFDLNRLKDMAAQIGQILSDPGKRVLDIGCATGGLLKELSDIGFTSLFGIDPSEVCVDVTNRIKGVKAFVGSLSKIPSDLGPFDFVVLSHVLEHVQDVQEVLVVLDQLTAVGGRVYVEVPNATRYRDFIIAPFQDFNTEHINHFSLVALRNLFRKGWCIKLAGEKAIQLGPEKVFPAIYVVAERMASQEEEPLCKDVSLVDCIKDYIRISDAMFSEVNLCIEKILKEHESIIVYGVGQLAMKLLRDSCLKDANIEMLVDGNPMNHGRTILGKRICRPSEIEGLKTPILIASLVNCESICQDIRNLGLENKVYQLRD